jgi:hypothetical protein
MTSTVIGSAVNLSAKKVLVASEKKVQVPVPLGTRPTPMASVVRAAMLLAWDRVVT